MKIVLVLSIVTTLFSAQLVNVETGNVIIEFAEEKIHFNDRFLETEMKATGIYIPPSKTQDFEGKEIVYLGDPLFKKAFIEIYYPFCIANPLYQWQDE